MSETWIFVFLFVEVVIHKHYLGDAINQREEPHFPRLLFSTAEKGVNKKCEDTKVFHFM